MDHADRAAKAALKVVGEPESGPADCVQVIVRYGDDGGARHTGQQALQSVKGGRGVPWHGERLDVLMRRRIRATADAVGTIAAGRKLFAHGFHPLI